MSVSTSGSSGKGDSESDEPIAVGLEKFGCVDAVFSLSMRGAEPGSRVRSKYGWKIFSGRSAIIGKMQTYHTSKAVVSQLRVEQVQIFPRNRPIMHAVDTIKLVIEICWMDSRAFRVRR
jgi:hypothetical protein